MNNELHGKGTLYYINGGRYEGNFFYGKRTGTGTDYFGNGEKYVGGFLDGMRYGYGNYYYADGTIYSGRWKKDVFKGRKKGVYRTN